MQKKRASSARSAEPSVKLSLRGVARLQARHPWVYRSDIVEEKDVPPGAMAATMAGSAVRVLDGRGKFLGTALYSSASQIAIRMISHGSVADLPALVEERIRAAIAYRETAGLVANSNAYRLAFSEADFLPGLIVDRYNDVVTVQILTQAMDTAPVREAIVRTLAETAGGVFPMPACGRTPSSVPSPAENYAFSGALAGVVERVEPRIRELEKLPPLASSLLWGDKSATEITMNGIRFHYDALEGQKTGAYLDQRENYAAASRYAHGEALDAFCYQGGFALHLARHCSKVTGVDSSRPALEMAEKNEGLNCGRADSTTANSDAVGPGLPEIEKPHIDAAEIDAPNIEAPEMEWIEANAFDLLRDYDANKRRYDTIVLDPPAFAKTKRDLDKALRGYKELNLRALKMLRPGGILVTCSCSFHVSAAEFLKVVADSAQDAHKTVRIIEQRGAAKDHPVLLNVPETSYLKCLILQVND